MREGGEIREVEDQESHGERQHRRGSNLRRERNPETHRADELSPPRLSPRRRRGPPRHAGEDVHDQQVHGEHREVPRVLARHRESPEDVRDYGLVREAVCEHGGPGRVHGERDGRFDLAVDAGRGGE